MPFMRRYAKDYLSRHPEQRGKDMETTRRSCEKFRHQPTTMVNFAKDLAKEKRGQAHSAFRNLLPPKAAGMAMKIKRDCGWIKTSILRYLNLNTLTPISDRR